MDPRQGPVVVTDPGDPFLADFVALNRPEVRRRVERAGGYFVVEGVRAIERLLTIDRWNIRRVVLLPKVADRLAPLLERADVPVAIADEQVLHAVVGFDLHRGALASVDRRPPEPLDTLVAAHPAGLFVVAEGVNDHENIGSVYRNAAAFGADAVVLDPTCADPFYRRSVRVSLGHVLSIPTSSVPSLPAGLETLQRLGITTVALTPSAPTDIRSVDPAAHLGVGERPVAVLVGAEGPGLSSPTLAAADHRCSIAMAPGVDSINVATALAVALSHLAPRGSPGRRPVSYPNSEPGHD